MRSGAGARRRRRWSEGADDDGLLSGGDNSAMPGDRRKRYQLVQLSGRGEEAVYC